MSLLDRARRTIGGWRLGTKLTVATALAVTLAVFVVSGAIYVVVRNQLRSQVDQTLVDLAAEVEPVIDPARGSFSIDLETGPLAGIRGYAQFVDETGPIPPPPTETMPPTETSPPGAEIIIETTRPLIPVTERTQGVVAGSEDPYFEDLEIADQHVRVYTSQVAPGVALQVARPLEEVDETLTRLGWVLLVLHLIAVAIAAGLGRLVARAALSPVEKLIDATEHVSATSDLTRRIDVTTSDELGRLAQQFNAMLAALETSVNAQKQLVGDASHELRTPITSIRTNFEVLQRAPDMPAAERREVVDQVVQQIDELTTLVNDLIEIVRGGSAEEPVEDFRLDDLVDEVVRRRNVRADGVEFHTTYEPTTVQGVRRRIDRAVSNLVDNAVKWSPKPGVVEVAVADGEVRVRDHGPGIDAADSARVFDRFYRAPSARAMPGFGLGLAIVKDVAEAHGGSISVENPPEGGALLRLRLLPSS